MMEAVEATLVEGAVLWLAQTILANLLLDKLDAWLRQVGLANDIEKLKSEVEEVEALAASVKGRAAGNRLLALRLSRLKELLYETDDLVDELDYCRLQHQVEGGTFGCAPPHGTNEAEQVDGSRDNYRLQHQVEGAQLVDGQRDNSGLPNRNDRKKRSKAWEEFNVTEEDADGKPVKAVCVHCGTQVRCETTKGTSVLHNHLKSENCKRKRASIEQTPSPLSATDGDGNGSAVDTANPTPTSRKRMRPQETSTHNAATSTNPGNMTGFSKRIQEITRQLQESMRNVLELNGSDLVATPNICKSSAADPCRITSCVQNKMYGRDAERNSIIKLMTGDKSEGVIILPIVGIAGTGKTALAQVVYNGPIVKCHFDHRIWIWVSSNFDEMRLTVEMLDFVSQEKHEGISSLAKLQEILVSYVTSKRTLLILDDVWDDIDVCRWNKLLAPLRSDSTKGNVILVTTRKLYVAKRIGTVEHINLGRLEDDDFWLFFKSCAFGDENYKEHPSLTIIGKKIANNLQGNPLAAQTAGMLLREHLTTDHWSSVLKNEKWKSLQLNGGIMHALKLSYDALPYYLQQCFLYCSLFPNNHQFLSNELVCIWISQGFVKCCHLTERLEEIGQNYLTDLLNSGFIEQVESKDPILGDQTLYVMPALMHGFARLVSGTECAAIDDLACREVPPTIRHLSILTSSAYHEDQHGNILRNEKFEGKLRRVVESTKKLRTLVLVGKYDHFFFQSLQCLFQKAQSLRALQISEAYAGFGYSAFNLVNSTHVRYVKLGTKVFPGDLSKFYHLQVLDMGFDRNSTVPVGINNLISLRHLIASKAVYSSISTIGKMTSLQELHDFNCSSCKIAQLQSLSELAQLGVSQLENVLTREEAYGAKLREKSHLEKLHLSWKDILSEDEYGTDTSSELSFDPVETGTSKEVFEGLEPHLNLKHLRISGYPSTTSPDWLVRTVSVTGLQTLHLEDCRKLQVLPSLERFPFLTKLKLRNLSKVRRITIPSLEELVLIKMRKLKNCSCNSARDLNSSLRVLTIEECCVLEVFPLFEICEKLMIEQKSWLSSLSVLTIHDCPQLIVSNPLPPSSSTCKLSIARVLTLPTMEAPSNTELIIGEYNYEGHFGHFHYDPTFVAYDEDCNELVKLDDKILSFHNLRDLTRLQIKCCQNLSCISLKGFRQLISLKSLELVLCKNLFSSDVLPEHAGEAMADAGSIAMPSLKHLEIVSCGITGKWLSVMLQHAPALENFYLKCCDQISGLLIEGKGISLSNHTCTTQASPAGNPDDTLTNSTPEGLLRIPSNLVSSLKKINIAFCDGLTFEGNKEGLSRFTSLEELNIYRCSELILSLVQKYGNNDQGNGRWLLPHSLRTLHIDDCLETLQPCFLEDRNSLRVLDIYSAGNLRFLQLYSCTALETLRINACPSFAALEGNLTCLKKLVVHNNAMLESLQLYSCTALETLEINTCPSFAALEGNLTCLKKLVVHNNAMLESLQLYSCTALETLEINTCPSFAALEGNLTCLKKLVVHNNVMLKSLQLYSCTAVQGNLTCLKKLVVHNNAMLESLQLYSCTALEELTINTCPSVAALEGNLTCLKKLVVYNNTMLESLQLYSCTALEELTVECCEALVTLEGNCTCLRKLGLMDNRRLKSVQLRFCTALKDLMIYGCKSLDTLEDFR